MLKSAYFPYLNLNSSFSNSLIVLDYFQVAVMSRNISGKIYQYTMFMSNFPFIASFYIIVKVENKNFASASFSLQSIWFSLTNKCFMSYLSPAVFAGNLIYRVFWNQFMSLPNGCLNDCVRSNVTLFDERRWF